MKKIVILMMMCLTIILSSFIYADYVNCNMTLANETGLTTNNQSVCGIANTGFVYDSFFSNITDNDFTNFVEFYLTEYKFYVNYTIHNGTIYNDTKMVIPYQTRTGSPPLNLFRNADCYVGTYPDDFCSCINHSMNTPSKNLKLYLAIEHSGTGVYCIDDILNSEYPIVQGGNFGTRVRSFNIVFGINDTFDENNLIITPPVEVDTEEELNAVVIAGVPILIILGVATLLVPEIALFTGIGSILVVAGIVVTLVL
jgi:hypothetical protein